MNGFWKCFNSPRTFQSQCLEVVLSVPVSVCQCGILAFYRYTVVLQVVSMYCSCISSWQILRHQELQRLPAKSKLESKWIFIVENNQNRFTMKYWGYEGDTKEMEVEKYGVPLRPTSSLHLRRPPSGIAEAQYRGTSDELCLASSRVASLQGHGDTTTERWFWRCLRHGPPLFLWGGRF